ncbi:MAG: hypothetical protein NWE95_08405 [Candidatus Bathyarchaeota archaeon]|nr:hypothetical protein [Candidatus Bathyarchaeota archaeon]
MPTLDLAMPAALLFVVLVAMFLNKRAEGKLMATVEQKEFKTRDVVLLIVFIAIVISVIAYTTIISPGEVFSNVLMVIFLSSYATLLFTFSFVFSNLRKRRAQLLSVGFGIASLIAGSVSLIGSFTDAYTIIRAGAFFVLAVGCFAVVVFEQKKAVFKERWYIAAQPPALFVLLFVFFNVVYGGTASVWFPVLMGIFGFTFAILIIMYLSSMFNWKTVGIFAVLLTMLDIILVFTGPMVAAAQTFTGLGLPVLIYLPNIPILLTQTGAIAFRGLGLGDFFFAGILAVQTYKKFGKKAGIISAVAMTVAFGIWEAYLPEITAFFKIGGFPATVCIISGWLPVAAYYLLTNRRQIPRLSEQMTIQPDNSALIE